MAVWKRILVSGSNISDLVNNVGYATTGSNTFQGNQTINGNVVITGSLTAQQYILSSSVIYVTESNFSGSHVFGNSLDDTHQFTGSVLITGSSTLVGNQTITGSILMSGSSFISGVDYIDFDTTASVTSNTGRLFWNDVDGTLELGLKGGVVNSQLGQGLVTRVVNKTVPNIDLLASNYQVVVISGATGQRLSVKLAQADVDANSAGTLGLVAENIAKNQEGFVVTVGLMKGLNTTGTLQSETWNDGDILYLSPTTAGAITNVKPQAPQHTVIIGYVEYKHAINGRIYVKIDNGYELDELHNVRITTASLATGDLLMYDSSSLLWKNSKTLSGSYTLSGSLVTNDGVSVQTLTASFVSASSGITGSLFGTASWAQSASQALTASYTPNALITASVSTNVLTFTKGDGTTFNLTVNTGSGGGTPGGADTEIQFNKVGAFSGSQYFKYNYVSQSLIQGFNNTATGLYSHAEGANNQATGQQSHAEGSFAYATGFASHAEGRQTQATAFASHAEGYSTVASGWYSHAEGDGAQASATGSHAEGISSQAIGDGSHAEGSDTTASGYASHAEGYNTDVSGYASHAEGGDTIVTGNYSHAEGLNTQTSGYGSHVEGSNTSATATGSHAEGYYTIAGAHYSHAEGWKSNTTQVNIATTGSAETLYAFIDSTDTVVGDYTSTTQNTYLLWETNQVSGGNRRLWLSILTNTFSDGAHRHFNITALDNQGPFGTGNVITGSYVYELNSRSNSYDQVYTYIDYDDSVGTITVAGDLSGIDTNTYVGVVFTIPSVGTVLQDIDTGTGITYDGGLDVSTIPLGTTQTSINNDLPSLSGTYSGGTVIFTTVDSGTGWGSFYEGPLLTTPTNITKYYDSATSSSKFPSSFASFLENNSYVIANNEITLITSSSISGSEVTVFYATNPYVNNQYSQLTVTKGWGSHAAGGNNISTGTAQNSVGVYNNSNYNSLFIIGDGYDGAANRHNILDVKRGLVTIDGNTTITGSVNITGSLLVNGSPAGGGGTPLATLVQSTPSNSWTFNHSLGVTNPIVTVYDSNNKVIIPQEISASNSNTLIITFPTTLTGTAVAAGGTYVGTTPTNAITASYALLAATASLAPNYVLNSATSSMLSPYVLSSVTSSMLSPYALSSTLSSYVLNSATSSLATTGSNTFNGDQTINGDLIFGIPSSPGFNGEIVKFGSGTLTAGLLYFLSSSGTWSLADATITSSSIGMLGIAVGSSPTANGLLIRGFAANASYNYGTGAIVYMQTGSGVMTATAPTGTNQVVRVMGYQTTTANTIYFDPDKTWVTLA